jgi:GT2 family glycosyltransferase
VTPGGGPRGGRVEGPGHHADRDTTRAEAAIEVLVVAYGAPDLLDKCLAAVDGDFPVTVIDNSSRADVRAVVEGHRAAYVDPGENLGFGAGVNVGLALLPEDVDVLLLNPDATIDPDGVLGLHRCLHADPGLAVVAPDQVDPTDGSRARVGWPFPTPAGAWVEAVGAGRFRRSDRFMIGSVLLLRAEAVADVGRFDERFFLYAEETDWQRRASNRGWRVALCPEVVATHVGAGTGGDSVERDVHFHASNERYLRKHYGSTGWAVFRTGVMAGALVRALALPGDRGHRAAAQFHLYRRGPLRSESRLPAR